LESDDLQNNTLAFFNTKVVKEQRKPKNFQQICDILYFHILYEHNLLEEYSGVVTTRLDVSFSSCIRMLEQVYTDFHAGANDKDFSESKKYLYKKYAEFNQYIKIFNITLLKDIIATIKLNLLFRKITNYIMMIISKQEDGGIKKYFLTGINEIEDLERLKKESIKYENHVPLEDLAYRSDMVLDRSIAEKIYEEFLNLIKKYYDNEYSFILKYMEIGNLEMSSGERAFQNFFSWLNLIPTFNKIDNKVPDRLHDTILLLIDEIDLYLHPEWQRNIIYNIMQEIKRQFSTYKVQIIFATHSPLVLSDIPRESTIYLSSEDRRSIPDKIDNHRQTFGTDIYALLNDAFYLKEGSMGKFATIKINNIIKRLETSSDNHSILSDDEVLRLNDEILGIGNELIKKKLLIMLDKCSKEVSKIHRINLLEKRKERLEKEIRQLTSGVIE
jgi:predicted ATP-binding protein involved in virulence